MTKILCIETATEVCSVAISVDGTPVQYRETNDQNSHSERLTIFIVELLKESSMAIDDLDAIAVSMGPGSYTGLRIGTSTAKGFCYGLGIPLIAISSLEAIANGAKHLASENKGVIIPMIDARRMEVYTATYAHDLSLMEEVKAKIVDEEFVKLLPAETPIVFCGNAVDKCKPLLQDLPNAIFADSISSARFMADLAFEKFKKEQFEDVAYFEPFYLKDFIAAHSYVKGLR